MTRLLSQPGIPKLRALARSGLIAKNLHLKGKGHEFSDAAKLLNYYQLWLDNLYPRAKFADGLQLVEKAGHSKRMQTMRKEWIDEGKPGYAREKRTPERGTRQTEDNQTADAAKDGDTGSARDHGDAAPRPATNQSIFGNGAESEDLFFPDTNKKPGEDDDDAAPEEDELDALLAEQDTSRVVRLQPAEPESEGEDDLDALLAEQESKSHQSYSTMNRDAIPDEEDDLDALQAERDASDRRIEGPKEQEEAVEDEDDHDALRAERESRELGVADASAQSSSPFPTIDDDDYEDSGPVT
jgi:replication fork protection complex subunit Csm3/Swi3